MDFKTYTAYAHKTDAHGHQRGATYALLVGFCLMMATDVLLG